jgi:4-hydroxy-tetrahydrodipicolinate synthase
MIEGSIVAIVTPMLEDGSIDYGTFDKLLEWHIASGTGAIVVVGTTGESATLTADEHCELVKHCVQLVNQRVPVIAGTGSNNTKEALFFTQSAKEHGADACLLVTPYYNRPSQEGLFQHFKTIADSVDIPQILYNVPSRTACDILNETVERLADHKNIVGLKDATGDVERGLELIDRCADRIAIYSGEDAISLGLMLRGAKGAISVTANVAPELMSQMCKLAIAGNQQAATAIDQKLMPLHQKLFVEANPIPVKWALTEMGMIKTGIRLPLTELDSQFHIQVRDALQCAEIGLAAVA